MIARLTGITLSALIVIVSQTHAGDRHCTGVLTDQSRGRVGVSLGSCDLTQISPYDFEKVVDVCGQPHGFDEDTNKATCNVVGAGPAKKSFSGINVVKRIVRVRRVDQ
jgi:hypothetical protein